MGAQIPVIVEKSPAVCGCREFQVDSLGDHLCTCTTHSGAKKTHDWTVHQLADLFRTTHKVKTQQVVKSRGQHCGGIELAGYLANADSYSLIGKLTAFLQVQELGVPHYRDGRDSRFAGAGGIAERVAFCRYN